METEKKCPKCLHGYTMARKRLAAVGEGHQISRNPTMYHTVVEARVKIFPSNFFPRLKRGQNEKSSK